MLMEGLEDCVSTHVLTSSLVLLSGAISVLY